MNKTILFSKINELEKIVENQSEIIQTLQSNFNTHINNKNNPHEVNEVEEEGSNENGNYIRYKNGVQICYHIFNAGSRTQYGTGEYGLPFTTNSNDWVYPREFIEHPLTQVTPRLETGSRNANAVTVSMTRVTSIQVSGIHVYSLTNHNNDVNIYLYTLAIGRWK